MEQRKNFPKEEYDSRISKLQNLMAAQDLEGILMSQAENLIYFSGYQTSLYNSNSRPLFCFIPIDGLPTLVIPRLEMGLSKQTSYITDIRCWGNLPDCQGDDPLSLTAKVIKEKQQGRSKIGIEFDGGLRMGMSLAQYHELIDFLPNVLFESSAGSIWNLRSVKSWREIEYMQEACRITDRAVDSAIDVIREGISEKEVTKAIGIALMEEGADLPRSICVNSGEGNYNVLNGFGTDRVLQQGDMINFSVGVIYAGYCSDITRSVFLGIPSKKQAESYEAIKQVQEITCQALRPGITASKVGETAEQAIIELGYKEWMLHRAGHGIGLDVAEPPSISSDDDSVLKEGTVLVIDPGIYQSTIGAFRIEDIVVVTAGGFEFLSHSSREIVIK